jgi:formylglycine-generating enzyme required for sulfatase activity
MHRSLRYLKSGAKALSKVLARSVANGMGWPEHALEIPVDLAWEWGEQLHADLSVELTSEEQRQAYLEVIKPGPDYTDDELIEAVNAGFLDAPEPVRMTALALLGQVQSLGRQSLKRLDDPSGTTLPVSLRFDSVEDHAARLPNALPRYNVGDTPIQGYVLAERLGVGGFGEVWKAHNPKRPKLAVALKFFTDSKARDWLASHEADVLERVQTEVRHPGIVRLQNVHDDLACLQFEFVKGWTLSRQVLDWHTQATPPDAQFIAGEFKRIVEILVDVHDRPQPIVHRDLKPANILAETLPGGQLNYRITDFGIGGFAASEVARNTRQGTLGSPRNPSLLRGAHSPLYASDEQKKGLDPDPRDDIFSLGVLWFQMQTGRLDSGPPTGFGWSKQLQKKGLSEGLVELMASCFESKADDRPASAKVLVERLDALLTTSVKPDRALQKPAASEQPKPMDQERRPHIHPEEPKPVEQERVHRPLQERSRAEEQETAPRRFGEGLVVEEQETAPRRFGEMPHTATENPPRKVEHSPNLITTKTAGVALKLIPAGTFLMGSPWGEGEANESPQHKVTISRPFYLGIHPVTQGQYAKLMGKNPSYFAATGGGKDKVARMDTSQFPVESVNWYEAAQFCNALSKAEGHDPCYKIQGERVEIAGGNGFRLPTEAEWEYACRAGTSTAYSFEGGEKELGNYAWFDKNSGGRPHVVGETKANKFGLHDMHGNVWEWTWDTYEADYYLRSPDVDPIGPAQATYRVFRGGGWRGEPHNCRSTDRDRSTPGYRDSFLGFRVARVRSGS